MFFQISNLTKHEAASGILLAISAAAALALANSPLASYYALFIETPVEVRVGPLHIAKPLLLWINDGLMAVFFFLVGLELKREMLEGNLSDPRKVILPALGAMGGMIVPAAIYILINHNDKAAIRGWAIPTATDIAFALGVLSLLGKRVPTSLKVFLVSLAIFDDIGAVIVIAIFYTSELSTTALIVALAGFPALFIINRRGVQKFSPYFMVGIVIWIAVLKSGVHATLAGVALSMFIPIKNKESDAPSLLHVMERDLHGSVVFGILPLFAFANSGISISGVGMAYLLHPVPLGIAAGLFIGKQLGVFAFCWIGVKAGVARLPEGVSWGALYGTAVLCGIGFTMSLFISSLAFTEGADIMLFDERLGIITGSLFSAIAGYIVLRRTLKPIQP